MSDSCLPRRGRRVLFTTPYAITDYEEASELIVDCASRRRHLSVLALPVHGLIEAVDNPRMREAVSRADLVVPDGQPVRWALNSFYHAGLTDRVYGPTLLEHVFQKAARRRLRVFLYGGSSAEVLRRFGEFITTTYAGLSVVGSYREEGSPADDTIDTRWVRDAGAHILVVGKGCPLQEIWALNHRAELPCAVLAVGAAFSFFSGSVRQAPPWVQRVGLEWLFRLIQEPRRLWRRYIVTNSRFIGLFLWHRLILRTAEHRSLHEGSSRQASSDPNRNRNL